MPVKRRAAKARAQRITPEAIEAFAAGDHVALHSALGLTPWNQSPLDVDDGDPPDWMKDEFQRADWKQAQELRLLLIEKES
jgi:hypothetical protein